MFATMIIQLPTEVGFEGGELIVKHKGSTKTFDGSLVSSNMFRDTVLFADCEHELLTVKSGTRVCLAFNLVRHGSTANQVLQGKEITSRVEKVQAALEPWLEATTEGKTFEYGEKVAIPLQHKYTEKGLSFAGLKGGRGAPMLPGQERRTDGTLVAAFREMYDLDYKIKSWIGMDDEGAKAFEMVDINMRKEVAIREGEDPFRDDPDDVHYVAYTGNEDAILEQWYHRAMLVMWPRKRSVQIACGVDFAGVLGMMDHTLKTDKTKRDIGLGISGDEVYGDVRPSVPWLGIKDVVMGVTVADAVQMVGWEACSSTIVDLVKECTWAQAEVVFHLAERLVQMGNQDAAVIVAKKPCEALNARIDELCRRGTKTFCEIRKTRHAFEAAMQEVTTLRIQLKDFVAKFGIQIDIASGHVPPALAGHHCNKRQEMETEVIKLSGHDDWYFSSLAYKLT
ncbi:unnamed protein product [Calypogeia fissa]